MKRKPIHSLTGLRGVAAFLVIFGHSIGLFLPRLKYGLTPKFVCITAIGMKLFFVLSGFVIYYNYSDQIKASFRKGCYQFFVARIARIFPLYFFLLGLEFIFKYGYRTLNEGWHQAIFPYILGCQTWWFRGPDQNILASFFGGVFDVSWSISTELFFYLIFPLAAVLIAKLKKITTSLGVFFIFSLSASFIIYTLITNWQSAEGISLLNTDKGRWLFYLSPYWRCVEFLMGCLAAAIYMKDAERIVTPMEKRWGARITWVCLVSLLLGYLKHFVELPHFMIVYLSSVGSLLPYPILIYSVSRYSSKISGFLSKPLILTAGEISYSTYLIHVLIMDPFGLNILGAHKNKVILANLTRMFFVYVAIYTSSAFLYKKIEIPGKNWVRRRLLSNRKDQANLKTDLV